MNDLLEEMLYGFHTQSLPGDAQTRTMGRVFTVVQSPSALEDLPNRHVGEQSHRKHHPQHHLMGQRALSRIDPARGRKSLLNVLGADNLFESRQTVQSPGLLHQPATYIVLDACESQPPCFTGSLAKKVTRGCRLAPISTVLVLGRRIALAVRARMLPWASQNSRCAGLLAKITWRRTSLSLAAALRQPHRGHRTCRRFRFQRQRSRHVALPKS